MACAWDFLSCKPCRRLQVVAAPVRHTGCADKEKGLPGGGRQAARTSHTRASTDTRVQRRVPPPPPPHTPGSLTPTCAQNPACNALLLAVRPPVRGKLAYNCCVGHVEGHLALLAAQLATPLLCSGTHLRAEPCLQLLRGPCGGPPGAAGGPAGHHGVEPHGGRPCGAAHVHDLDPLHVGVPPGPEGGRVVLRHAVLLPGHGGRPCGAARVLPWTHTRAV